MLQAQPVKGLSDVTTPVGRMGPLDMGLMLFKCPQTYCFFQLLVHIIMTRGLKEKTRAGTI